MSRHKKLNSEPEPDPDLDISSLIDVCFLLLIYFLVTSTIKPRETDLGMALPSSSPSTDSVQPKIEPMFIRVDASGAIFANTGTSQQPLDTDISVRDVPLLSSQLELYSAAALSAGNDPLVQIFVDEGANQQRVIDVLNALAGVGITSVTFTDLIE
ncbi:ExbD/TolR family protein [Luteolibacter sp. AS25]|uniref:ExbD/TolR family protein n=1 Tax=Luteolibacter sp. AS25 TaxID=3135776 RepID=UPI00398A73AB